MSEKPWTDTYSGYDAFLGELHEADLKPDGTRVAPAYTRGEGHRLIIGPTGSGKFQAAIGPLLLTADRASAIVFDVASGEAARDTGPHRAKLGPVLVLDPYRLASDGVGALNPLDALGNDDGGMLGRAARLADAVMMHTKSGGDADYWNGQARDFLVALLIHTKTWPHETSRTLARIRDLIRGPVHDVKDDAGRVLREGLDLGAMQYSRAAGGYVADAAHNITEDLQLTGGRNFFYVRQTLRDNTAWLDAPEIQRVTATTTLDLRQLRERVTTLYVVAPARELRALGRWLRLVYATVLPTMLAPVDEQRHHAGTGIPLHLIMDEFAAFGAFERVTDDMATVRKYGLVYHLAVQKLSQLKGLYRDSWETFIPKYLHILGSDEHTTSEYVSKRIGNTVKEAKSTSHTRQAGGGSQGESLSFYSAPYLEPNEIAGMDANRCLVVIQGSKNPLELRKVWMHSNPELQRRKNSRARQNAAPGPGPAGHRMAGDGWVAW